MNLGQAGPTLKCVTSRLWVALPLFMIFVLASPQAWAMTNFARKYSVACTYCHTQIPALNENGYKFRAAGFRTPDEIGKDDNKKFDLGDIFAARLQGRYDTQVTNQPNGARGANLLPDGSPGPRTTTNAFSFFEATLYPLTGAWGKYFSSLSELSVSPEDVFEIENAYVRFTKGIAEKFFSARIGVFHPWEGFGASDRPYDNSRTLFQTSPLSAGGKGVPYVFQPWGLDEAGLEVGGDIHRLSLRAAILGGTLIRWSEEAQAFLAFPAQTGPWKGANQAVASLTKPYNSLAHNTPDFSANATYILHSDGGGVSLLYYRGTVATPTTCTDGIKIGRPIRSPTPPALARTSTSRTPARSLGTSLTGRPPICPTQLASTSARWADSSMGATPPRTVASSIVRAPSPMECSP